MTSTQPNPDVIVVGSGFGGAVAAARFAQAGFGVLVLERGRRWAQGEFPRGPRVEDGWLWEAGQGLYDIRWLDGMGAVQGAGWGGGSLVYANVFARPADATLEARWPAHLRRGELDPYYDLAAHMLQVRPVTADPRTGRPPDRQAMVERLVSPMDVADGSFTPNLAVTFGDVDTWRPNVHGVPRRGCAFVGECVLGCNHGAKNSLDHTYLAVAERAGATGVTDAEVTGVARDGDGYAVTVRTPSDPEAPPRVFRAPRVVLAAGAVATTELLLRARDVDGTLPDLSPRLGEGFSGNGDFLALARGRRSDGDLTTGPTITTTTVLDVPEGRGSAWFQVQDGAYPLALRRLLDETLPARGLRSRWRRLRGLDPRQAFALLSMGHDAGDGRLRLDRHGRAVLDWRHRSRSTTARLYRAQGRVGPLVARSLGSAVRTPVTWSLLRRTTTVHPLGGVPAGVDRDAGVVDDLGEVHGAPGLFVMDGSVLPSSTGVNPSATILAVTERAVEGVVRASRPGWRAPEWDDVRPRDVPEDAATAAMARRRAETAGDGVRFDERMVSRDRPGRRVVLTLRATVPGMEPFLRDPGHPVRVEGEIEAPGIARAAPVSGVLHLFPDDGSEAMAYDLEFADDQGRRWRARGTKHVRYRDPVGLLVGLTTLRLELTAGQETRRVVLVIGPAAVARLVLALRGTGFTGPRRARALLRFASFFVGSALTRRGVGRHVP
ncbi:GMC family oxidoreductase [Isoptericola cucumis]|uniref:GMC family oxidoreductase n=1 Tax=Isoptericola cucumis TaxID=1776856 RepID=UPI0032090D59